MIEERPDVDLAVVTVAEDTPEAGGHRFGGDWVSGLHPMAVNTRTERVTLALLRGRRYDVELRYEGWVQLQSRPVRARRDLAPLAAASRTRRPATPCGRRHRSAACSPGSTSATARRARSPPTPSWSCSPTTSAPRPRPGTPSPRRADAVLEAMPLPEPVLLPSGSATPPAGTTASPWSTAPVGGMYRCADVSSAPHTAADVRKRKVVRVGGGTMPGLLWAATLQNPTISLHSRAMGGREPSVDGHIGLLRALAES